MVIFTYLARRFVGYVVVTSLLLAFLFNFIEFFEKLVRVKHTTATTILSFLQLNFLPSLFDSVPIAGWLATCLLLKELFQRGEWEILQLLSFVPRRFFIFVLTMGLLFGSTVYVVRESVVVDLASQAERFKQEHFKQERVQKIIGKWVELTAHQFAYFSVLDLDRLEGLDLLVVTMNPRFALESVLTAPTFSINPTTQTLRAVQAQLVAMDDVVAVKREEVSFQTPALLPQLRMSLEAPTLRNLGRKLIIHKDVLPVGVYRELLSSFFMRMVCYLQLLLYPVLTFCLFYRCTHGIRRWVLALLPYPLFIVLGVVTDYAVKGGLHPFVVVAPYCLLIIFLALFWAFRIRAG